jgi:hypothetical protein
MTMQEDARAILIDQFANTGVTFTPEVLDAVLMTIPVDALLAAAANRVRWEWWDGVSPVNGVLADQVRDQFVIPDLAFLVYVDDGLVYFQPHDPTLPGIVPLDASSDTVVAGFVDGVAQKLALDAFVALATGALQQVQMQQQARTNVVPTPADMSPQALRRRRTSASGG